MKEAIAIHRFEIGMDPFELHAGQSFSYGRYQGEGISWRVLEVKDGKALLITEQGLDVKPFHNSGGKINWGDECSLKNWLNNEFFNNSFSRGERAYILPTPVKADRNPEYKTNPGADTVNFLFLFSITELEKYFAGDRDRQAVPSRAALNNNAFVEASTQCCWWWLRTPGKKNGFITYVGGNGWIGYDGCQVCAKNICVRPAMWIRCK